MKLKLARFSTIILFALVMGVFWGTWFALSRSIIAFRAQTFLDIGQTAIRSLAVPMSTLMPLALMSAGATAKEIHRVWIRSRRPSTNGLRLDSDLGV
jgi:hypothetical protein